MWVIALLGISTLWGGDTDGDGYSDEVENYYDWNVSLVDQRIRGGFSRTDSGLIGVSLNGGGLVRVRSDPSGMIPEYTVGLESNSTHLPHPSIRWLATRDFSTGKETDRSCRSGWCSHA